MSLIDDVNEAKKLWKGASPPVKGVIVLTIFITTSSITSLADHIFAWKGFILDGVEAYRELVTQNIVELLGHVGLRVKVPEVDVAIVLCLLLAATFRASSGDMGGDGPVSRALLTLRGWRLRIASAGYLLGCVLFAVAISHIGIELFGPVGGAVFTLACCAGFLRLVDRTMFLRFASPLVIATASVLLLGAINVGLTRT